MVNAFAWLVHDETSWTRTGVPLTCSAASIRVDVGSQLRVPERMGRRGAEPAGDEREEHRDRDDHRPRDEPPAPVATGEPDEQHDRRHVRHRRRRERRPLRREPGDDVERPEPPVVLPPQVGEAERQRDEPQADEQHHAGDDGAPDSAEAHLADRPRQQPGEHAERGERRSGREQPENVQPSRVAACPRERVRREVAALIETGQMQRRHARPPEQPRCSTPHHCADG